jgi:hypothetical protein
MKKLSVLAVLFVVFASSCLFRNVSRSPGDDLTELANKVDETTYAAVYRAGLTRQFAPGQTDRLEIVQQPPVVVRKLESTTQPEKGKPVKVTSWYIHNEDGDFACSEFPDIGVRCQAKPISSGTFGNAKLDVFFDTPREERVFSDVRKDSRTIRIHGQQGSCFEAVPVASSAPPTSPAPAADRFRYELCYADDGILLQGKRTSLDDSGTAESGDSFVEIVSLSRVVNASELRLPGELIEPADL